MELPLPANALEFDSRYGSDEACLAAVLRARWPKGFVCPKCKHHGGWVHHKRLLVECSACGYQASVVAGTLFHAAKLGLRKLFKLIYLLVAEKSGTNMCALSRQVGISYNSALLWTRKVRRAMVRPDREPLSGTVEIDETTLGGPAEGHPGRSLGENQALIVVMVEDAGGNACGRVRLEVVASAAEKDLTPAVKANVSAGSVARTDGWSGYAGLGKAGYKTEVRPIRGGSACQELPLVHRVASLLKRFVNGVLHGSWTHRWLPMLLDEFVFRFNRRGSHHRPQLFNRVLETGLTRRSATRDAFKAYSQALAPLRLAA